MKELANWRLWLMASLTLGLAPFFPKPHVVGKIKWLLGGAKDMRVMDILDLLMHGTPWVLLILSLLIAGKRKTKVIP